MNRSEELCRLLGIYKVKCTEDEQTSYTTSDEICNNCDPDYKNCWSRILIYSDLTKPNNFVKLLDLLNAYLDIRCDCLMAVVPQIIDKAIFLASTNSSRFIDKKDKFKKQAQATKWDY